jgi:hypothetical protein
MKNLTLIAGALSIAVFAAAAAAASLDPASVKSTIQRLYNHENTAAGHLNVAGIVADLDPNFISIDPKGETHDYQYALNNADRMIAIAKSVQAITTIRSCTITGNVAALRVYSRMIVTFEPGNGGAHTDVITDLCDDTWILTGNRWRQIKSVDVDAHETIDGHPVNSGSEVTG